MGQTSPVDLSPEARHLHRFTRWSRFLIALAAISLLVLFGFDRYPRTLILGLFLGAVMFPLHHFAGRIARRNQIERAVFLISVSLWVLSLFLGSDPRTFALAVLIAIMPILLGVPFLSPRVLLRIIIVSVAVCVVDAVIFGLDYTALAEGTSAAMDRLLTAVFAPLIVALGAFSTWRISKRLSGSIEEMREANQKLAESERLLETKVRKRTEELQAAAEEARELHELTQAANTTLEPARVMERIMAALQRGFPFDLMYAALLDEERKHLWLDHSMGKGLTPEELACLGELKIPMGEEGSAFVHVVGTSQPFFLGDVTPEVVQMMSPTERRIWNVSRAKSLLICPMEIENEVVGAIVFGNSKERINLSREEIGTIRRYVTPLSAAMRNARLFAELDKKNEALKAAAEEARELHELTQAANTTLEPARVMERIMAALQRGFPFDLMYAALLDEERKHLGLDHSMGKGLTPEELACLGELKIPMDEEGSAFVHVVGTGQPFFLGDVTPEVVQMMSPTERRIWNVSRAKSLLICPMEIENEVVGAIVFGNSKERINLSREEIGTIRRYVTLLSAAIRNARLFEEARSARAEAVEASQAKSKFLASMSHELRTPLNAIIGYGEILREEALEEGNDGPVPDLEKILSSGRFLLTLINSVLDLSKIEAGKMEIYLEECDVAELVRGVGGTVKPLVEKNENRLEVSPLEELGAIHTDVMKLRQMLFNLLSNASKFTRKGTIRLDVARRNGKGGDWLHFRVTDSGIGMNEEQLDKVFEEFSQAEATTTKDYGGTGLGLPITKKFCEMLRGSIDVTSEPGKGSCFEVRLPAVGTEPYGKASRRGFLQGGRGTARRHDRAGNR